MLGRLSPDQDRHHRRGAVRTPAADLGHHMACSRARHAVARHPPHDRACQVYGRVVRHAGSRDGAGNRFQAARIAACCQYPGALRRTGARRLDGPQLRPAGGAGQPRRDQGTLVADQHRGHRRRLLVSAGRAGEPRRRDAGLCQGRAHGRGPDFRTDRSHADPCRERQGGGRDDRQGADPRRILWSSAVACGRAIWRRRSASRCRCMRPSISTS